MRPLVLLALLAAACRSSAPVSLPERAVAEISPKSGAVSAKLLEDPTAPGVELGPGEEFVRPELNAENKAPQYPAALVAHELPAHTVAVRVTFDENGRPTHVVRSPIAPTTDDEYTADFEAEVRRAVSNWKCWPARIRKFRPGPDGDGDGNPDYRILAAQKALKAYFDLSFSFEVLNGQPVVKQTR